MDFGFYRKGLLIYVRPIKGTHERPAKVRHVHPSSDSSVISHLDQVIVIMELPNQRPALKLSQDLHLVSGVLQDMKDSGTLQPSSPGIPPVAFGAGGPM